MAGTREFGAFVAMVVAASTWLQLAILVVAQTGGATLRSNRMLAPGPYGLVFALFALFHGTAVDLFAVCFSAYLVAFVAAHIPKLHPRFFSIFGLNFSDKSFYYLLGAQLFWYHRWESAVPSTIGLLLGVLYQSKFFPLHHLRLPAFVESLFRVGPSILVSQVG